MLFNRKVTTITNRAMRDYSVRRDRSRKHGAFKLRLLRSQMLNDEINYA